MIRVYENKETRVLLNRKGLEDKGKTANLSLCIVK